MSVLSELDLLYRDGAVTQNDFIERGISPDRAKAFAQIVADTKAEQSPANRLARDIAEGNEPKRISHVRRMFGDSQLTRDIEADHAERPVCPNCEQWADNGDCFNECAKRGFAPTREACKPGECDGHPFEEVHPRYLDGDGFYTVYETER